MQSGDSTLMGVVVSLMIESVQVISQDEFGYHAGVDSNKDLYKEERYRLIFCSGQRQRHRLTCLLSGL